MPTRLKIFQQAARLRAARPRPITGQMAAFDRIGPAVPESPIVVSVPHAGREYPAELTSLARVPMATLAALEDRCVDAVALAALTGETALVQRRARAWIDLNRDESERDPELDPGAAAGARLSPKVRVGLGLVPRRLGRLGALWRRTLTVAEVDRRIVEDHRPYHAALAALLDRARQRFGTAVLLDLHSMPALPGPAPAQVVIGDRFGTAASARFVERIAAEAAGAGLRVQVNVPYAGGAILARHGRPAEGVHAVQLEIDRALYLDRRGDRPGGGLAATAGFVRAALAALADECLGTATLLAAE